MSARPDEKRSRLRGIVADMETAMGDAATEPMRATWQRLVTALDLGPEPAVRACPRCGELGMRAATRCGYCWLTLAPAPAELSGASPAPRAAGARLP